LNARRNEPIGASSPDETPVDSSEATVDRTTVLHLQLTTSLIEGRAVGLGEVIGMIDKILRQLSIDKDKEVPYRVFGGHGEPP